MAPRVAILFSGGGSNMEVLVKAMLSREVEATPVVVITNVETAGGLQKAADLGVKSIVIDHRPYKGDREAFETDLHKILQDFDVDLICLAGFMRILTPNFIQKWDGKMLNTHPSLLPKYKGLHTHQRAIDAGDSHGGCSVHIVTSELDGGPVLGQTEVPILDDDTADTLAARVLTEEHKLYPEILAQFAKRHG
jgi:phosphoribosylglycinamide formyltransferase-1